MVNLKKILLRIKKGRMQQKNERKSKLANEFKGTDRVNDRNIICMFALNLLKPELINHIMSVTA